ncbi:Hsp70 family protein [Microbacterium aurantiacum]|uniref:Hsp70 family protein n=2 Tax=Microbacterium aurantiacum TaxID=162393 RepID=UPI00361C8945
MLFGDAAERRGLVQPERLVREVKRRVGDEVPVNVGGRTFAPEDLLALLVDWVSTVATERFGRLPSSVVVTVPVAWGTYRTDLIRAALVRAGIGQVEIIAEPVAAARHYEATNPLAPGSTLAVYDFGGGTFDAVLLRKTASGSLTIIGSPTGIEDLGGADFDDAVLRHVLSAARLDVTTLLGDADARVALAGLRRECVEAKEALSFDSEATVPVLLGGTSTAVRLTRDEFEAMIENDIERTIEVLGDAMEAAAVEASDLDAILLTGGSSRIPRVAQLLSERFDRPIAVDTDPKAVIALGAALEAADAAIVSAADAAAETEASEAAAAAAAEDEAPPARPRRPWLRRVPAAAYVSGGAVALAAVVAVSGAAAVYAPEVFGGNAQLASENGLDRGGYSIGAPLPTSDALAAPLRIDGALFTGDTTDAEKKAEAAKPVEKVEVPAPLAPVVESPFRRVDPPRERANPRATPFQGRGVTPSAAPRGGSSSSPSKSPSSQPTKKPSASPTKPSNPGTPPPSQTGTPVPPAETPPPAETTAPVVPDPPAETTAPVVPDPPAETTAPVVPDPPAETTAPVVPDPPAETTAPVEPEPPAETTPPVEPEPEPSGTPGAE